MATQTTNYGLGKPAWDDRVDVSVLNNNSDIIDAQMKANEISAANAVANMADAYDATATYAEGDYCTYGGKLYQANTDISVAEAFDATHWDETTAAEHFSDGGGGGGGGDTLIQPVIYSDTEREIGVWRNGKPLYQKTIHLSTVTAGNNTITYSNYNISNVEDMIDVQGFFTRVTSGNVELKVTVPNSAISGGSYNVEVGDVRTDTFNLAVGSGWSSYTLKDCYLTLRYTKTTDTAGSGIWTPSGVPAVHYSTDEQIVGTWIDGKTLYQKTFYYTHTDTISGGFTTVGTISGVEYLEFHDCAFYSPTEGRHYSIPYANGSSTTVPYLENGNIQLRVSSDTWGPKWDVVITVRYTKTTS